MKVHSERFPCVAEAKAELNRLNGLGLLDSIEGVNSLGILRTQNGNENIMLINAALPRARIKPFFESPILGLAMIDFYNISRQMLGEHFLLRGYAGTVATGGAVSYLHADSAIKCRLNMVISGDGGNMSTMVYAGEQSAEPHENLPMVEALRVLGSDNFRQPEEGQVLELSPDDYHGEPPIAVGTPRLFLASTIY